MVNNSTQRYIDIEKGTDFLSGILTETPVGVINGINEPIGQVEIDIDLDIEKRIAQLQESRLEGNLEKKIDLSIDPDKQLNEWQFEKNFENFLENVDREKEVVERNIEEEEKKIKGLESLFDDLMAATDGKKKKKLLKEPEKIKPVVEEVKQVILKKPEKLDLTKTKEQIEAKYIKPLKKEETFIDEEARKVVAEKYGQLGHAALHTFLSPKQIESDPDIINKVQSHISEMKVANELEKDKMTGLRSIDTLEKLTREFLNFKNITSIQMSTIGGGGSVNILDMDDVNISTKANGYILKYNASTERMDFIDPNSSLITGLTADGSNNITVTGNLTVEGTTTTIDSTTIEIQNSFKFEGATADAYETNLTTIDPTADRTISLPNATGTIVLQDTSDTLTNKSIDSDNNTITNIVNADIKAAAAISFSKMENLTVSRALVSDSNGDVSISAVTSTEIGYLDGVTSSIQTQIDANTTLANTKASKAFAIAQAVALG
jgi:hypothetical protein